MDIIETIVNMTPKERSKYGKFADMVVNMTPEKKEWVRKETAKCMELLQDKEYMVEMKDRLVNFMNRRRDVL